MTDIVEILWQTARNLDALVERDATGGSASTIVDTRLNTLGFQDDEFNGGTAFVIAATDGLAPSKESRFISDFVGSTGVISVEPDFSATVAAGDIYGIVSNRYPRAAMVSKLNKVVQELGDIPTVDTTSLTTAAGTRAYTLPFICNHDLRQVWLEIDSTLDLWEPIYTAYLEAGDLIFPYDPPSGKKIKLVYMNHHHHVYADDDWISDYFPGDWVAILAAIACQKERLVKAGADDKTLVPSINDLMEQEKRARNRRTLNVPVKFPVVPHYDSYINPGTPWV